MNFILKFYKILLIEIYSFSKMNLIYKNPHFDE